MAEQREVYEINAFALLVADLHNLFSFCSQTPGCAVTPFAADERAEEKNTGVFERVKSGTSRVDSGTAADGLANRARFFLVFFTSSSSFAAFFWARESFLLSPGCARKRG